ncbi:hypothetical protein [Salinibacter altiplanensis]|uniref:hypothetical protein n=1 Tax=Salinibacter altiplanensis TaxID=1803181 RepID=UPI00131A4345|nr:hypothetical protein [Salinibacter altiplanensis]
MLKVAEKKKISEDEWRKSAERYSFCTVFQSPEWHKTWSKIYGKEWNSSAYKIKFEDGAKIIIPVTEKEGFFDKIRLSSPEGTYGGAMYSDEKVDHTHIVCATREIKGNLNLRENPFDKNLTLENSYDSFNSYDFTQALTVNKNWGTLKSNLSKNDVVRRKNKAEEKGLRVKIGKFNNKFIKEYYGIYQKCRESWGDSASNNYSRRDFEIISEMEDKIDVWYLLWEGDYICCGPIFKQEKKHAVSWLTLASPDHLDKNPYELIYYEMIKYYNKEGFNYFDFNPSGGHEGVVRFKEKFDTDKMVSRVLNRNSNLKKIKSKVASVLR